MARGTLSYGSTFDALQRIGNLAGGVYPRKYIIATFPSFESAVSAKQALLATGLRTEDVRAVSGREMLDFLDELRRRTGLLGDLMTGFSRLIGAEASFFDQDIWEARHNAGFLAVHCASERVADNIRKLVIPLHPTAMQWYRTAGVSSLV
jgi:hypothetical protein